MNEKFTRLTGIAAPLPLENVDTDLIWPVRPDMSLRKGDQAGNAFATLRYDDAGNNRPEFILNQRPWTEARILVTGGNFGCGSSREMAVWSLYEWGLRCIIAPSFGDIFFANAALNGMLLVTLPEPVVRGLITIVSDPDFCSVTVDLTQRMVQAKGMDVQFDIEPHRRECLLQGLDNVEFTLRSAVTIQEFGKRYAGHYPWTSRSLQH